MTEQRKMYCKSGNVCAVLSEDGRHWILPLYRHPPIKGTTRAPDPSAVEAAHMARCVPSGAVKLVRDILERIDGYVFGGGK